MTLCNPETLYHLHRLRAELEYADIPGEELSIAADLIEQIVDLCIAGRLSASVLVHAMEPLTCIDATAKRASVLAAMAAARGRPASA